MRQSFWNARPMTAVLAFTLLIALAGCAGPSYINIPPQAGDVAMHGPNRKTARAVAAAAANGIIEETPLTGTVRLAMPEGTESLTYAGVAEAVGHDVVPYNLDDEAMADTALVKITGVRVRSHKAEVDAIRAKAGGAEQLVTAHLSWDAFSGWTTDRVRAWQVPLPQQD